jgi:hypothetical protein
MRIAVLWLATALLSVAVLGSLWCLDQEDPPADAHEARFIREMNETWVQMRAQQDPEKANELLEHYRAIVAELQRRANGQGRQR